MPVGARRSWHSWTNCWNGLSRRLCRHSPNQNATTTAIPRSNGCSSSRPGAASFAHKFGTNVTLYLAVTTFLKRGGKDLLPDSALAWLYKVVSLKKGDQKFSQMNGENTVALLKLLIAQKDAMLKPEHRKLITLIADILTDDGVRGAGFLHQELLRAG
jgi:hypothetical protein